MESVTSSLVRPYGASVMVQANAVRPAQACVPFRPPVAVLRRRPAPLSLSSPGSAAGWGRAAPLHAATVSAGEGVPEDVPAVEAEGSTFVEALLNVTNIIMGVGLLSIPFALKSAGWAGIVVLLLLAVVNNYTGKALVRCSEKVTDLDKAKGGDAGPPPGYPEIAEAAFGIAGKKFLEFISYFELMGTCTLLVLLESDNLYALLSGIQGWWSALSQSQYIFVALALIMPTMWLPNLSCLAYLGIMGVCATITVTSIIGWTLSTGAFLPGAETALVNPATLPLTFGILAFVYAGHGIFPSVHRSMKRPQDFPQVLNVAYLAVALLCTFLGAAGYYMYGSNAADVIIFNLTPGLPKLICSCMILINPIVKFAITMEPVASAATARIQQKAKLLTPMVVRLATRTTLAFVTMFLARSIPFLGYLMSLVGAFMTMTVSVIMPTLCYRRLCGEDMSGGLKLWNSCVTAIGLVCAISGTAAAVISLAGAMA